MKRNGHELATRLWRLMVWLYRWRHCRGFGIQSPSDYRFVCYVVNEHWPYYAYSDLKPFEESVGTRWHRLGLFFFRLSNYWHPQSAVLCGRGMHVFRPYLSMGCRRTSVTVSESADDISLPSDCRTCGPVIWIVSASEASGALLERILGLSVPEWVLVVVGIHRSRGSVRLWKRLLGDPRVRITFDLYDAGVVFFDKSRAKQNYTVNF